MELSLKKIFLWLLAFPLLGCEFLLTVDTPQCENDRDCVGLLGKNFLCSTDGVCVAKVVYGDGKTDTDKDAGNDAETDPASRWECLTVPKKPVTPKADQTVEVSFSVLEFMNKSTPKGLVAKACNATDIECESPVVKDIVPDAEEKLRFTLPHGFDGYFELSAPDIMPSVLYRNVSYTSNETFAGSAVISPTIVNILSQTGVEAPDLSTGTVMLELYDCNNNPADGVHLEKMDGLGQHAFYYSGALPDSTLEATTDSAALGFGRASRSSGGFVNVESGYMSFRATLFDTTELFDQITVYVRSGYITYVTLYAGY